MRSQHISASVMMPGRVSDRRAPACGFTAGPSPAGPRPPRPGPSRHLPPPRASPPRPVGADVGRGAQLSPLLMPDLSRLFGFLFGGGDILPARLPWPSPRQLSPLVHLLQSCPDGVSALATCIQRCAEGLARAAGQGKEKPSVRMGKEEGKLTLFADDISSCL